MNGLNILHGWIRENIWKGLPRDDCEELAEKQRSNHLIDTKCGNQVARDLIFLYVAFPSVSFLRCHLEDIFGYTVPRWIHVWDFILLFFPVILFFRSVLAT